MIHDGPGSLLRTIVAALEAARIPHMVVGSFASTVHGEPRTTRDLDLVIDPSLDQLSVLLGTLDPEHFYVDPDRLRLHRALGYRARACRAMAASPRCSPSLTQARDHVGSTAPTRAASQAEGRRSESGILREMR